MGPRKKLSSFIAQQNEKQQKLAEEKRVKELAEKLERERVQEQEAKVKEAETGKLLGVKFIRGMAGTGQTYVEYPQLLFHPQHLFALGSPIGLFLTVR